MKIYFVRHGHADHNAAFDKKQDRAVYRSLEYKYSKLTEKGKEQIESVAIPKMDRVYSSPIIRCVETSRILVGDDTILYLHDGLMETQGPYPCNWRPDYDTFHRTLGKYILKDVKVNYTPYTDYYLTDVSETESDVKVRATKTLNQIKDECADLENVLVVTHNDWLESLFGRPFKNGEVYIVNI